MSLAVQSAIDATKPLHNASPAIDTDAPFGAGPIERPWARKHAWGSRNRAQAASLGAKTRLGRPESRPRSLASLSQEQRVEPALCVPSALRCRAHYLDIAPRRHTAAWLLASVVAKAEQTDRDLIGERHRSVALIDRQRRAHCHFREGITK